MKPAVDANIVSVATTTPTMRPAPSRAPRERVQGTRANGTAHTAAITTAVPSTPPSDGSEMRPNPPPEHPLTPHQFSVIQTAPQNVTKSPTGTIQSRCSARTFDLAAGGDSEGVVMPER